MKLTRFLAISSLVVLTSLSLAQSLNIGDKAPKLNVTTWVKGKPQTLGNGKLTVVEFWATWCGPCKVSIPHITEMAHKYKGKVNFVGVSISESKPEDYTTKVPAFVKEYGDKMDYNVATEGPNKFMSTNWMQAAGEGGIPTAFLVDQKGNIAWIGHPMDGLDKAIDSVLSGKADLVAMRAERTKAKMGEIEQQKAMQKLQAKMGSVMKALQAKKFQEASDEADKIIAEDPASKPMVSQYKLIAMVQGNLKGLGAYLDELSNEDFAKDPMMLNQVIWTVVEMDLKLSPEAYVAAAKLGEKMMKMDQKNAMNMDTYALALWRSGDKAKALETQKMAVTLASTDKNIPAETVQEMKDRLKQFGG
jgi:thiol-disulfide isomerase/thioredoxin